MQIRNIFIKNLVVKASLRVAVINRAEEEDPEKKQFIVNHQKNNLKEEEGEKKQLPWTTTRENMGRGLLLLLETCSASLQ